MKQVILLILLLLVFALGFKIGDSRGFEAGYKVGYTYDCREEIKSLRDQHIKLKKDLDEANKETAETKMKNVRLQYAKDHYQDSLDNVERVKHLNDSIDALNKKGHYLARPYVDPYTGKVLDGPDKLLKSMKGKK